MARDGWPGCQTDAGVARNPQYVLAGQVGGQRLLALTHEVTFVGLEAVQRLPVLLRVNGHGADTHRAGGAHHADRDLGTVGDQDRTDRVRLRGGTFGLTSYHPARCGIPRKRGLLPVRALGAGRCVAMRGLQRPVGPLRGASLWRSGAERADFPAVLGLAPASRNSLRALRALRSDKRDENDDERATRVAQGLRSSAPQRRATQGPHGPSQRGLVDLAQRRK